jgi:hypothetical protein
VSKNPKIIHTRKMDHLLAHQGEMSVADLAARQHPRQTACGRRVTGITGEHLSGDFSVRCASCRNTRQYAAVSAEYLYRKNLAAR